jgi:hypothetical protein
MTSPQTPLPGERVFKFLCNSAPLLSWEKGLGDEAKKKVSVWGEVK